ncbi:hypothetical protein GCM10010435_02550 [Winogradskya consettensis]|uniref:Uncharacterized protein n=1 Tax=Winogradskya consettensis TaxID=113560 RepID=A0A919S787_9ACTN|nr:hypothetical protein Aco04nite_00400 [Actinoplanes consettensis]
MSGSELSDALSDMWRSVLLFIPAALAFVAILIIGWLLARLVRTVVAKALSRVGFDRAVERGPIGRALGDRIKPSDLCAKIAFYAVLLFALQLAFGIWGPNAVSDLLTSLVSWLPRAFIAIVIIVVVAAIGGAARDLISSALGGLAYGRLLAQVAYWLIVALGVIAALDQVQIATTVTQPVLIAVLATIAGVVIVGVGGGLIRPMQQRWDTWLERAGEESAVIRQHARTYSDEKARLAREAEEEARRVEAARIEAERQAAAERAEAERKAAEAERRAAEERAEAERKAAAERAEAERKAEEERVEAARRAEEERVRVEAERAEAARKAEEERAVAAREAAEDARRRAEEEQAEAERVAEEQREEAVRDAARRAEHAREAEARAVAEHEAETQALASHEAETQALASHEAETQALTEREARTQALAERAAEARAEEERQRLLEETAGEKTQIIPVQRRPRDHNPVPGFGHDDDDEETEIIHPVPPTDPRDDK